MSKIVIKVEKLGKKYRIGHKRESQPYVTLRDEIENGVKTVGRSILRLRRGGLFQQKEDFWALKNASFEVKQGDRIGVVGRNGAGKSTLLKLLSRITEPSEGKISIRGRVASLLEVGTGFHPELTGRENIYLNGAILGMGKAEIRRKFDAIVEFAEVSKFLDTPVKRYSSGMYVRLAFAVAAHLDPEVLLVDEVLAVGDAQFQKKCLCRMGEVSQEGKTVLFVSHNLSAIQKLCNKGILVDRGQIIRHGDIADILAAYQGTFTESDTAASNSVDVRDGQARFVEWRIMDPETQSPHCCFSKDECTIAFSLVSKRRVEDAFIGMALWNADGHLMLAGSSLDNEGKYYTLKEGLYHIETKMRLPLKAGRYQLDVSLNSVGKKQIDRWSARPQLTVLPRVSSNLPEHWHGMLNEDMLFECKRQDDAP